MRSNLIDIEVKILYETDKAYLITDDDDNEVWIPKSVCEMEIDDKRPEFGTMTLPESYAQGKGLI